LLVVYLAVIAVGLGFAWKRWRWTGLLPVAFSAGYALGTAVGRFSGWRYDLPADWISYFYFGIGFAEILSQAALLFGQTRHTERSNERQQAAQSRHIFSELIMFASLFVFIGGLPWLGEKIAAPRYPDQSRASLEEKIVSLSNAPALEEIDRFLAQPDSFLQIGRAAYPRFFGKSAGLSSTHPWPAYALRDYPRLGFLFLNQKSISVVFPTKRIAGFPHAADAIVLGCQHGDYVEARLVALPALDTVYLSEPFTGSCSP
jgi:hypothetical protein